jgi:hypothetical protein
VAPRERKAASGRKIAMAQDDKGLVMRGLFLLALIGTLVVTVLAIIFWRQQEPMTERTLPPEFYIAPLAAPSGIGFPSHVSWPTIYQLSQSLPSEPGWEVRYNAAATLARRGSANVPWPILREMLDEKQQLRNQGVRLPDGQYTHDEVAARGFTINALKALTTWHEKQTQSQHAAPPELRDLYALVDELAQSPHADLKDQAEKTRRVFFR